MVDVQDDLVTGLSTLFSKKYSKNQTNSTSGIKFILLELSPKLSVSRTAAFSVKS